MGVLSAGRRAVVRYSHDAYGLPTVIGGAPGPPPYCPELTPIERVWPGLHAVVTRSHRCATIDELMTEVRDYLRYRNRTRARRRTRAVA